MLDKRITNAFAIVILVAWSISFIADIVIVKYDPPASVHAAMMAVVGSVFVSSAFKKEGKSDK